MKFYLNLMAILAICHLTLASKYNTTCYYDTSSIKRGGDANFTVADLELSLHYCTHLVYGYVGIRSSSFDIQTLHNHQHAQFTEIKNLKRKYRNVKFLLSVGGNRDLQQPEKYLHLLQASAQKQEQFYKSAIDFMKKYQFDGLDLAYQFPTNKPKKHHSKIGAQVKKFKKLLPVKKSKNSHQESAEKRQFSQLSYGLKTALKRQRLMLSLTVLPNVNATMYFDIPSIIQDYDFITLAAFDFHTPERNPKVADFLAPITAPPRHKERSPHANIDSNVRDWLSQRVPAKKLNLGIATYGRTWRVTKPLKSFSMPIDSSINGPAVGGEKTHTPGLLSWPEICPKLNSMKVHRDRGYGDYAFRSGDIKGQDGILITYETPDTVAEKASYVEKHSLGGIAVFDLSLDDFRGKCKTGKFPILKSIKFKLI